MKNILLTIGLILSMSSISFATDEEKVKASPISANITIANDYVWRGKTQTNDKKAIQGGFDYDAGNGFALGIWGSNVTDGSEFDYYGSYSGELENGLGYEVGYISYVYSKDENGDLDFKEAYIGGSYGDFGVTYYKGVGDAANYVEGSYGTSISDIDVSATIGKYANSTGKKDGRKVYGLSFGKSYAGLDYLLGFTKTNENDSTAKNENNTVFSVSKSF